MCQGRGGENSPRSMRATATTDVPRGGTVIKDAAGSDAKDGDSVTFNDKVSDDTSIDIKIDGAASIDDEVTQALRC